MVVLQINKFFYEKGGAERYFFLLSDALRDRGHHVVHFSMRHAENRPSPFGEYFVSEKDYESARGPAQAVRYGASFIRSREAAVNIRRLLRDHRPDVAHLHNIYHQITPSIIPELVAARVPVVMTLHDYKLICPNYGLFARGGYCYRCRGGRFYRAALMRCDGGALGRSLFLGAEAYWQRWTRVYDSVHRFMAPSRYMKKMVVEAGFGAERIVYLPGFVPRRDEAARGAHVGAAATGGLPPSYILYFGRLSGEKGIGTLLNAAAMCAKIPMVICGGGPLEEELRARVSAMRLGNVHFAGYLAKPALDEVVARARVAVVPSASPENAPFTVLEAAAAGVPAIVSDMGGLPEMAELLGGWVFPSGDARALAALVREVWAGPAEAQRRGEAARAALREHFDRDRHVAALERIYEEARG
jgi:glycosyltransferase involved in cell wall biosynthesis